MAGEALVPYAVNYNGWVSEKVHNISYYIKQIFIKSVFKYYKVYSAIIHILFIGNRGMFR